MSLSVQLHKRLILLFLVLLAVVAGSMVVSTGIGDMYINPLDVWKAVLGQGLPDHILVVQTLRLPRIVIAIMVGASLGVAGAMMQSIIRNPLAAPDLIGVTGGASLAAVTFLTYLPGLYSIHLLPVAAMIGAVAASALIYMLAWKRGVAPVRLVLVGIGISALISSLTTMLIVMSPTIYAASSAYLWITGTIYGTSWDNVLSLLPWTTVFLLLAVLSVRELNIHQLGDDIAAGTGSAVQRKRLLLLGICVILAGSAVSMAGPIGFVGLLAPHMARRLAGPSAGSMLPIAGLLGGLIVLLADLVGRTAFLPHDIPVGVFTAGIGAPFFIYLLYRTRNAR
ncbi:iron ABC transporter permease [Paenibacillus oenotherae]|uniref:Iron ABC transporter permease n=2 Tax=Paenibacillus oenotherae TaxID=1435645 RepID=A0ABS7D6W4_9BACL|nr:iron ABC transporter permease [Paenibacillus oenotherae]MBW7474908.1 iron ABC transporter permease [Paenibacillus oenotherae]